MARNDSTAPTEQHDTEGDETGTVRRELGEWLATRPASGGTLLVLGSLVIGWQASALLAGTPLARITPVGFAGVVAPLFGVLFALVAVGRPSRSTAAGLAGGSVVVLDVVAMLYAPTPLEHPKLVFSALLAAGVGAVMCAGWRAEGPTVQFGRFDSTVRVGRYALVVGLVVLLMLNGAPAVAAQEPVPAQEGYYGGLVLDQGTLDTGYYSYQANCPKPQESLIQLPNPFTKNEPCLDVSVDSSEVQSGDVTRVGRQQLDNAKGQDTIINDFLIFKNFWNRDKRVFEHVELSADTAVAATEDGDDPRAVDVYISEYRAENAEARLNLVDLPLIDDPGIQVDNVDYWTCSPQNESGQGTINDIRFGADSNPTLTGGKDATLLAHQLGSTKTTLTNFALKVKPGRRQRPVADADPTESPSNCLDGSLKD